MLTLTAADLKSLREPTQESAYDWEQEALFARDGRTYRVTVYASTSYGPHIFTYAIDDDETGNSLFDSRVTGLTAGDTLRVNLAVVGQLARQLFQHAREVTE